jgi:cytochrome oxidase Cu insertion factor (SCO1/SenC/PrrC family)
MRKLLLALLVAVLLAPAHPNKCNRGAWWGPQLAFAADKSEPMPAPKVKVGDIAPDFTLEDQNGNKVSLHEFRGKKNVALAFYIFAFTGG